MPEEDPSVPPPSPPEGEGRGGGAGAGTARTSDDPSLAAAARRVLRANDTGRWTVPARAQYPHQWNWDSAFVAIGLSTFDWERAAAEIEAILAARWREGMLPHVRYDPW